MNDCVCLNFNQSHLSEIVLSNIVCEEKYSSKKSQSLSINLKWNLCLKSLSNLKDPQQKLSVIKIVTKKRYCFVKILRLLCLVFCQTKRPWKLNCSSWILSQINMQRWSICEGREFIDCPARYKCPFEDMWLKLRTKAE